LILVWKEFPDLKNNCRTVPSHQIEYPRKGEQF
jgi:hypothetical protein